MRGGVCRLLTLLRPQVAAQVGSIRGGGGGGGGGGACGSTWKGALGTVLV